jgi:EAL domain-containing protein (putative c-di-GMP-specific phosphodiesterase class I)
VDLGGGDRFHPTVSIGVSTARAGSSPERVVSEADAAMYRAKERGRNRAEFFTPSGPRDAAVTLRLTDDLHRAVEHDELELHYQPFIDVASGWTTGYEALLRWRHPERGLLGPDRFLDLAEETGLIVEIGEWVLRAACARAAGWPVGPGGFAPSVSVNVAARQLVEPGLVAVADDALTASGLAADRLWLEVTETALMADVRAAADTLRALRGLGLHLALDDFGTGYSSLTYLKRFPFESIKIDRTFVEGLGVDPDDTAIVEAVVGLARSLGLASVAEGVETPLQLRALGDAGCDVVQGYLLGRPQPVPTVETAPTSPGPTAPPAPATPPASSTPPVRTTPR